MNDSQDQLERDLRAALRAVHHAPVSGDAWQQNQRRLAASRSRWGSRLLLVAAAVVTVLLVGGLVAIANRGGDGATPAKGGGGGSSDSSSTDDVFADPNLLGPIAEVERLQVDGEPSVHEAALSDTSGKGPSLCDRFVAASSGGGGCTSRDELADEPAVAFDWLTGTTGGGDIRGVLAGVDSRVMKVQIWMDNGDMTLANLKPTGWEDTKMFALTVPADGPRPQRLVAYSDASGTVLQAADLPSRFGADWLRPASACAGDAIVSLPASGATLPDADVDIGAMDARINVHPVLGSDVEKCVEQLRSTGLAGWYQANSLVALVLAPEVAHVLLFDGSHEAAAADITPQALTGTPWRVATVVVDSLTEQTSVVAFDSGGTELDRQFLNQPASP
jgi:hypothetical protein